MDYPVPALLINVDLINLGRCDGGQPRSMRQSSRPSSAGSEVTRGSEQGHPHQAMSSVVPFLPNLTGPPAVRDLTLIGFRETHLSSESNSRSLHLKKGKKRKKRGREGVEA